MNEPSRHLAGADVIPEGSLHRARMRRIVEAFERSGFKISPCTDCSQQVVHIPNGIPICAECIEKEAA